MGREIDDNYKAVLRENLILSGKFNVKVTPSRVLRLFRAARYRFYVGKYFLIEKMAFLSMRSFCRCFHDAQIPWSNILSVVFSQ